MERDRKEEKLVRGNKNSKMIIKQNIIQYFDKNAFIKYNRKDKTDKYPQEPSAKETFHSLLSAPVLPVSVFVQP